jgi:hypothetical protein
VEQPEPTRGISHTRREDPPATGGGGAGPDELMDRAASTRDEEPAYAGSTPDAPPIAPPGGGDAFEAYEEGAAAHGPGKQPEPPFGDRSLRRSPA